MAKVEILEDLYEKIEKKFGGNAEKVFALMKSLEDNPKKGKFLGQVGGILIKELKYKSFRFYFIVDGFKLKIFDLEKLSNLLIKFVEMSDKKSQQKVINEIRNVLRKIGQNAFE